MQRDKSKTGFSFEEVVDKAIDLLGAGKQPEEIFALFPEFQEELREIFPAAIVLKQQKEDILPASELLSETLRQVEGSTSTVTSIQTDRYTYEKGRSINSIGDQIHDFMNTKLKVLIPAGAVVIVVLVAVFVISPGQQPQTPGGETPGGETPGGALVVPETDDVNELMAVLDQLADDEEMLALNDGADTDLVATDTEGVGDFGQSFDDF